MADRHSRRDRQRTAYLLYSCRRRPDIQLSDSAFRRSPEYCTGLCFCRTFKNGDSRRCSRNNPGTPAIIYHGRLLFYKISEYTSFYMASALRKNCISLCGKWFIGICKSNSNCDHHNRLQSDCYDFCRRRWNCRSFYHHVSAVFMYRCLFRIFNGNRTAPLVIYALTYFLAPTGVSFFAEKNSIVYELAVTGMRIYGLGFLFSGINIFSSIRMMAYGKGYFSGIITFLRSFALLLLFLIMLPVFFGLNRIWLAVPLVEFFTLFLSVVSLIAFPKKDALLMYP